MGPSHGRRVKDLKDYALGGKNFSTPTLTATIVATWIGGGYLSYTLSRTYGEGLYFIVAIVGDAFALLVVGQVLAVRMRNFLSNTSVAEAMGDL